MCNHAPGTHAQFFTAKLQNFTFPRSSSYNYVPTILQDPEDGDKWKMWWCGLDNAGIGDAIFYAWSSDKSHWEDIQEVMSADPNSWEGQNICDPSVLLRPGGQVFQFQYKFVMYYNGATGNVNHRVGYATSQDGIHWKKSSSNPILECETHPNLPQKYGLGQISAMFFPDEQRFQMTYVRNCQNEPANVHFLESWDGVNFFSDTPWVDFGPQEKGGLPGLDTMFAPNFLFPYMFVFTWNVCETVWGATSPMNKTVQLGWCCAQDLSNGSGWFRDSNGWRPNLDGWWGAFESAFGEPGLHRNNQRINGCVWWFNI